VIYNKKAQGLYLGLFFCMVIFMVKEKNEQKWEVTASFLSKWAGITTRAIQKLVKKPEFEGTKSKYNKYDFFSFSQIYLNQVARKLEGLDNYDPKSEEINLAYERARQYQANANLQEFKLEVQQGEYIALDEITVFLTSLQTIYNSSINAIPGRIAEQLAAELSSKYKTKIASADIYRTLREESNQTRILLTQKFQAFRNSRTIDPDSEPPAD
jgi:phage terminase Nu1 subunit (DNA packaging protein)